MWLGAGMAACRSASAARSSGSSGHRAPGRSLVAMRLFESNTAVSAQSNDRDRSVNVRQSSAVLLISASTSPTRQSQCGSRFAARAQKSG